MFIMLLIVLIQGSVYLFAYLFICIRFFKDQSQTTHHNSSEYPLPMQQQQQKRELLNKLNELIVTQYFLWSE